MSSSTVCSSLNWRVTKCPWRVEWINKRGRVTLCSTENEQLVTTHNNMGDSHRLNTQRRRQAAGLHGKYRDEQSQSESWVLPLMGAAVIKWAPDPGVLVIFYCLNWVPVPWVCSVCKNSLTCTHYGMSTLHRYIILCFKVFI